MPVATSAAITSATTVLYVSNGQPGSYTTGGFAALSWTEVGELSDIGNLGGTTNVVKHMPIKTGAVVKRSGSTDYGTLNLKGAKASDAGQTILQTAFDARSSISFKIVYPSALGTTNYFTGIVASTITSVGNSDQILGY
jgi:hypothetical protein